MISILIVEDDSLIGHATEQWLSNEYQVDWSRTVEDASTNLANTVYDIVLLDLGLPDGNGLSLLRTLKRHRQTAGVIIMTASGDVKNRVEGLDAGADDYLVKPIDFNELEARIRAVKRRKDGLVNSILEYGDIMLDIDGMTVTRGGEPVHLSRMEVSILAVLFQAQGRYFSKAMLEQRLYDANHEQSGNAVEVHISSLRKKLGKALIKNTRGLGYIIEKQT